MPKKYEPEEKARAIRMVREHLAEYGSITATCDAVGPRVGSAGRRCAAGSARRTSTPVLARA